MPDQPPPQDMTAVVAVLSHQIGELKSAIDRGIGELTGRLNKHGERISDLEEYRIRAEERESAEDRIRRALKEERAEAVEQTNKRVTLRLGTWQTVLTVLTLMVMFGGFVVAVVQAVHG